MLFGTPITMINGGINPVRMVILYPNKAMMPIDQMTPISTTSKEKNTTWNDLKNINRIRPVTNKARIINKISSLATLFDMAVLIYGIPE